NEAHRGELALVTAEKDLRRAEEQLDTVRKREGVVKSDLVEVRLGLEQTAAEHTQAEHALDDNRALSAEAAAELERAEALVAEWRERVLGQQAVVTDRKVRLARVRERANGVRAAIERLVRSCDELHGRVGRLREEQIECARGAGEAAAHIVM